MTRDLQAVSSENMIALKDIAKNDPDTFNAFLAKYPKIGKKIANENSRSIRETLRQLYPTSHDGLFVEIYIREGQVLRERISEFWRSCRSKKSYRKVGELSNEAHASVKDVVSVMDKKLIKWLS